VNEAAIKKGEDQENRRVIKLLKRVAIVFTLLILLILSLVIYLVATGQTNKLWTFALGAQAAGVSPPLFEETFWKFDRILPVRTIKRSDTPYKFGQRKVDFKATYEYQGRMYTIEEFLKRTKTSGLLVLKGDDIVYERYLRGSDENSLFTSFSAAKSFVSALVGIAIEEGHIESVDDPITKYVPKLKGTGYDGIPIKHILQMSSGIKFGGTWRYFNPFSSLWGLHQKIMFLDQPLEDYVVQLKSERPSGEKFDYAPVDTLALGMLLSRTTGKTVSAYLEEKIWQPMGMESDAKWSIDSAGVELCYGYLNATLKDYAKFGRLYLNKGRWNGEQVVPESWVIESVTPDSPHLQPNRAEDKGWGYQYQWWIPKDSDGEFLALGHFGQFIYVYPKKDIVIVKTSVYRKSHVDECLAAFRAIADYLQ